MMVTPGVMTMMVEVAVAAVVGMAISRQCTEEMGRRVTHNNQIKDDNAKYNNKAAFDNKAVNDDDTMYDNNITMGITIGWTPEQIMTVVTPAKQRSKCQPTAARTATMPAKQWHRCQRDNGIDASAMMR
jgi:hypothetical protein